MGFRGEQIGKMVWSIYLMQPLSGMLQNSVLNRDAFILAKKILRQEN